MALTPDGLGAAARVSSTGDDSATSVPAAGAEPAIRRAQRGDIEAFEEVYRTHVGRVHALCLRLTGDRQSAEELTQDVFVQAWRRLSSFRGESALSTWLHRLAVNAFLLSVRGTRRREARVLAMEAPAGAERGRQSGDADARIDLERAIATLPPGARMALVLHDIEGYRHEEIARLTGVAVGTVRAQLHRARRLLMQRLKR